MCCFGARFSHGGFSAGPIDECQAMYLIEAKQLSILGKVSLQITAISSGKLCTARSVRRGLASLPLAWSKFTLL